MTLEGERQPFQVMTRGPFAALLRVPEDGFSLREDLVVIDDEGTGKNTAGPWLVRLDGLYVRQYPPLAVANLHRRFARTEPIAESILAFADKYGLLGHGSWLEDSGSSDQGMVIGESVGFWKKEIERMARLVSLWEFIMRGGRRELSPIGRMDATRRTSQQVRLYLVVCRRKAPTGPRTMHAATHPDEFRDYFRRDKGLATRMRHSEVMVLAHEENGSDMELLERWKHGDPVEPVRYFVHREVNISLRGHVSPAVLPFRKGEIFFFPDCLLSSLYTQFMLELSGRSHPATLCERPGCGRYFEPTHGRQRYCDKRCQQLAYYYRRKEREETKAR